MSNPEIAYVTLILPQKLAINLAYLRRRTVLSDFIVLLATLWKLVAPGSPSALVNPEIETRRSA
jgi:hypothetical protein